MKHLPLRIAIATGLYAPFLTGVSIAVHQRVLWFLQQGHEVFLIHPKINSKYPANVGKRPMLGLEQLQQYPKFTHYAFPTEPLIFYKSLPQPLHHRHWNDNQLLEDFNPDVVLVEEAAQIRGLYSMFLQGYGRPIAVEYGKRTGTPVISVFHTDIVAYIKYYLGNQLFNLLSPFLPTLIRQFSSSYDLSLFCSRGQLQKYQSMQCQNSEYLPYQGVDCKRFNPENIIHNPIPDDHRPTLLFVGRITAEKNVTQLLDIYPIIADKIKDVHLVIIGSGPMLSLMRKRAKKFSSGVTVWGESHGQELLGWFARADVFVNPSVTENFCTTNQEALASGTPVVAAIAPSTGEQVISGHNGLLAQPNDPQDFANKVIQILSNPQIQDQLSQNARPSILKYDWSSCMKQLEQRLYQMVKISEEKLTGNTL